MRVKRGLGDKMLMEIISRYPKYVEGLEYTYNFLWDTYLLLTLFDVKQCN